MEIQMIVVEPVDGAKVSRFHPLDLISVCFIYCRQWSQMFPIPKVKSNEFIILEMIIHRQT